MDNLFFEARQNSAITDARGEVAGLAIRVSELERRTERMALVCQALWELLCERTNLTEEDIYARMQEVDLRDGKADGKISRTVNECPNCSRPISSRRTSCMYCGCHFAPSGLIR